MADESITTTSSKEALPEHAEVSGEDPSVSIEELATLNLENQERARSVVERFDAWVGDLPAGVAVSQDQHELHDLGKQLDDTSRTAVRELKTFDETGGQKRRTVSRPIPPSPVSHSKTADVAFPVAERRALSPDQRRRILLDLQRDDPFAPKLDLQRIFTDDQISVAEGSDEAFYDILQKGLLRSPSAIVGSIDTMKEILSQEEMKSILDNLAKRSPVNFLREFEKIKKFYPQDEAKTLIAEFVTNEPDHTVGFFVNQDISELFTSKELHDFLMSAGSRIGRIGELTVNGNLQKYIESGYITKDEAQQIILNVLQKDDYAVDNMSEIQTYFAEEDTQLKAVVLGGFMRSENPFTLFALEKVNFLTSEDKATILRHAIVTNSRSAIFQFRLVEKYLSADEFRDYFHTVLATPDHDTLFSSSDIREVILESPHLSREDKDAYLEAFITRSPSEVLLDLDFFLQGKSDEEKKAFIEKIVDQASPKVVLSSAEKWVEVLAEDVTTQKQRFSEIILKENSFDFIQYYNHWLGHPLQELFTKEEMRDVFNKQMLLGMDPLFEYGNLPAVRKFLGGDAELKSVLLQAVDRSPNNLLFSFDKVQYLFSREEINDLVSSISHGEKGRVSLLDNFNKWAPLIEPPLIKNFLVEWTDTNPASIFYDLRKKIKYIPEDQQEQFLRNLILANPVQAAIGFEEDILAVFPDYSAERMLQMADDDAERKSFAPKSFKELYRKFKMAKDPTTKQAIAMDISELYASIGWIRHGGLEAEFNTVLQASPLNSRDERKLLQVFQGFALLKEKDPESLSNLESFGITVEESAHILLKQLTNRMGAESLTSVQEQKFFAEMGSIAPFLLYYLQYENSPQHKELLNGMFTHIVEGEYTSWKYGQDEASFVQLQEENLLPKELTYEQYQRWQEDEATTLRETLAVDARATGLEIRKVLYNNNNHLQLDALDGERSHEELVDEIKTYLSEAGKDLAAVNRKIGELRRSQTDVESLPEYVDLVAQRDELTESKDILLQNRLALRLAYLAEDEIAAGCLLEGERGKEADQLVKQFKSCVQLLRLRRHLSLTALISFL